jgi:CYTH domain-containing protein
LLATRFVEKESTATEWVGLTYEVDELVDEITALLIAEEKQP